jgi:hypothetical protein
MTTHTTRTTSSSSGSVEALAQRSGTDLPVFRVSSFCTGGGCVEVGHARGGAVVVRDAKDPLRATTLTFSTTRWAAFLAGVRRGEFPAG